MNELTIDDLGTLRKPFAVNDHEFLNGNAYITESAITTRIEDVDPAWLFELVNVWTRDNQCVAHGRMTIKGVTRDGVGMQPLTIQRRDGMKIEATDPEKSAATDALKRCARLFGVGRYLLDLPDGVNDKASMQRYLGGSAPQQNAEAPATPKAANVTHLEADGTRELIAAVVETKEYTDKKTGELKKRLVYHCADGVFATAFSTRAAREAGYDVTAWGEVGEHDVMPPAVVTVKQKGDFWDAVAVRPSVALGATGTDDIDFLS